jgi:hypothetical protein
MFQKTEKKIFTPLNQRLLQMFHASRRVERYGDTPSCQSPFLSFSEKTKQTFRDKVSGTYVIKKDAEPTGTGALQLKYYHITSLHFIVLEVKAI